MRERERLINFQRDAVLQVRQIEFGGLRRARNGWRLHSITLSSYCLHGEHGAIGRADERMLPGRAEASVDFGTETTAWWR